MTESDAFTRTDSYFASEHSQGVSAALIVMALASMGHWIGHGWFGHGFYTMNALLEEWFYRGFLDARLGPVAASMNFGAQHAIVLSGLSCPLPALLAGVACVPASLVWSTLARRTGGILVPFLSHMTADLVLFAAGLRILGWW